MNIYDCSNWHSSTTDIWINSLSYINNHDNCDIHFNSISKGGNALNIGSVVNDKKIILKKFIYRRTGDPSEQTVGYIETDSLLLTSNVPPTFYLGKGSVMIINKGVKALMATPCNPATIKSTSTLPDEFVTIRNGNCGTPLYFYGFQLQNVHADLTGGCTPTDYQVLGENLGGSTGFEFTPFSMEEVNLTSETFYCNSISLTISSGVKPYSYHWYKDDVLIPDATTDTYSISEAGEYKIVLDYTDTGGICQVTYRKTILENTIDSDLDGVIDRDDLDDDNDGILDVDENAYGFIPQPMDVLVVTLANGAEDIPQNMISEFSTSNLPGSNITVRQINDVSSNSALTPGYFDGFDMVVVGGWVYKEVHIDWWNELENAITNKTSNAFIIYNDRATSGGAVNVPNGLNMLNNVLFYQRFNCV